MPNRPLAGWFPWVYRGVEVPLISMSCDNQAGVIGSNWKEVDVELLDSELFTNNLRDGWGNFF